MAAKELSEDGMAAVLKALVSCGDAEERIDEDGVPRYRLTAQGHARAEAMLRKQGIDPDCIKKGALKS